MADDLHERQAMTPEQRIIMHLGYSMSRVRDLPPFACDDGPPRPVDVTLACREAFYMHARTVAEFFVRMPRHDWTARDFLPGWEPPEGLAARLERVWLVATKNVAHMSKERVPDGEDFVPEDTSLAALTQISTDCQKMLAEFVAAYRRQQGAEYVNAFSACT